MASDEDYAAFLDKANQDNGSPQAQAQSQFKSNSVTSDTDLPPELKNARDLPPFQTETDEDWEPFALKWTGNGPLDCDAFAKLIGIDRRDVVVVSDEHYENVARTVKSASSGGKDHFRRFEITCDRTRIEIYYVTVVNKAKGDQKVVGFKAKGVRS